MTLPDHTETDCSSESISIEIFNIQDGSLKNRFKQHVTSGSMYALYALVKKTIAAGQLALQLLYDFNRLRKYSSAIAFGDNRKKLQALLTMAYHSIEKGLSLPDPRPGFGKIRIALLQYRLIRYLQHYGCDEYGLVAFNVLKSYERFNRRNGIASSDLQRKIDDIQQEYIGAAPPLTAGGIKEVLKKDFLASAQMDIHTFFNSRHSVRQYTSEPVALEDIKEAVRMAQKTPSVCNRQSSKVWLFQRKQDVQLALDIQGGAAGFKDGIGTVIAVSSDLSHFQSAGERNQCWIDGGLFAMSLVYALHSKGLVTCCLNWSKKRHIDKKFKHSFNIPDSESIIMLISVGHPLDQFMVAQSWRKPLSEILHISDCNTKQ